MKKFFSAWLALGATMVVALSAQAEPLSLKDLQFLTQPFDLSNTEGQDALVLHYDAAYGLDSAGDPFRQISYLVLAQPKADLSWISQQMVTPHDGKLEVEQIDQVDPQLTKFQKVSFSEKDGIAQVQWPQWNGEQKLFVVTYRQFFDSGSPLGGVFYPRCPYPVKEATVRIRLPKGGELFYFHSLGEAPIVREDGEDLWYGWNFNFEPKAENGQGLILRNDPFVVFSLEPGTGASQLTMDKLDSVKLDGKNSLPLSAASTAQQIRDALDNNWKELNPVSSNQWRDVTSWTQRPVTSWEAAAYQAAALRQCGLGAKLWWQTVVPMNQDMPNTPEMLLEPVIEIESKGVKPWYYAPLQTEKPGELPEILGGRRLYRQQKEKLIERKIEAGKMSANRLTANWNLELKSDGTMKGTLDLIVRAAWLRAFDITAKDLSIDQFEKLDTLVAGDIKKETLPDGGVQFSIPVHFIAGILTPDGSMVANSPALYPVALRRLAEAKGQIELAFPFVLEQTYQIKLPQELHPLELSPGQSGGDQLVSYQNTQRLNHAKHQWEATEKILVHGTSIENETTKALSEVLQFWGVFNRKGLPLVK